MLKNFRRFEVWGRSDRLELEKFQLVNPTKLRRTASKPLGTSIVAPWRAQYGAASGSGPKSVS